MALRQHRDDPGSLLEHADKALDLAKHGGRNRLAHNDLLS